MSKARVTSRPRKQEAFTLIELLIVLGIIAVLVAILVPALNHGREQARLAVCLSNLRQLAYAMESYFQDSDAYPIYAERFSGGFVAVPWAWGGRTPALEPWRSLFGGAYWVTANERPVNRYLGVRSVIEPDPITADNQRAEIEAYHCPSDRPTARFRWNPPPPGLEPKAAYDDIGTSYQINRLWPMQWHQGGKLDDTGHQRSLPLGVSMAVQLLEPPVLTRPTRDVGATPRAKEHRWTAEPSEPIELSVVIPVFNEERTVEELIRRVLAVPLRKQIIVVNDGSTDSTASRLEGLRQVADVEIITHADNRGKGAAVRTALRRARGWFTIIQDADLEYDPSDYLRLLKPLAAGMARVVYGSRYLSGRNLFPLPMFRLGVKVLNGLVAVLYARRLTDEATCYKAFDTKLLRSLGLRSNGFDFCAEVTAKVLKRGIRIHEVPIRYHGRTAREGKKIRWFDGLLSAWSLVKYRFTD